MHGVLSSVLRGRRGRVSAKWRTWVLHASALGRLLSACEPLLLPTHRGSFFPSAAAQPLPHPVCSSTALTLHLYPPADKIYFQNLSCPSAWCALVQLQVLFPAPGIHTRLCKAWR